MLRNRIVSLLGMLVVASMVLAACEGGAPTTPTQPAAQPTAAAEQPTAAAGQPTTAAEQPTAAAEQPTAATEPSGEAKPFRVGIFSDLSTVNYWAYLGPNSTVWNGYVQTPQRLTLYAQADQTFVLVPQLAEGLPERPLTKEGDFFVATVKMKQTKWSDGSPLTAKDIAFTANTAIELQLPGNWSSAYDPNFLDHVEATDDYTVKFFYKSDPGLAVHEYGSLQAPIMSEKYWTPVVEEAKTAVGALTAPADNAPQEERDAYQQKLTEALNVLFNHEPNGEPLAGAFTFGRWERGAFVENNANQTYLRKGAVVTEYANGAYQEVKAGDGGYEIKVGDPVSEKTLDFPVGPFASSAVYTIYGSQDAAVLALKNGEIDYMLNSLGLQRGLRAQIEGQEGLQVIENPTNGFRYMSFNERKKPLSDKAFRQAVATLIDKEFVTTQILQGAAYPIYSFVPQGNAFWFSSDVPRFGLKDDGTPLTREERLAKAIEILEAAGYKFEGDKKPTWDADNRQVVTGGTLLMPDGTPIPELELLAPGPGYDPLRSTFAIWIEQWLREFGIPVKARLTGFNVIIDQVVQRQEFDMYILGWSLTVFPDFLRDFFHSERTGLGDQNSGGFSNPDFDKAADEIKTCTTLEACKEVSVKLQQILADELPYVLLFDTGIIEAFRSDAVSFPYTQALGGLQFVQGLPEAVQIK